MDTIQTGSHGRVTGPRIRSVNAVLGTWLIVSSWVWPHSTARATNCIVVGSLAVITAGIAAFRAPWTRFFNAVLGVWLFVAAYALPSISSTSTTSRWNDLLVGSVMIAWALIPGTGARPAPRAAG